MGRHSSRTHRPLAVTAGIRYQVRSAAPDEVEAIKTLVRSQAVVMEIKAARNVLDTSLKAHLADKGELCLCCELPNDLCRCVKRAEKIRQVFQPLILR
jgi:hypothetical protein